MTTPTYPDPPTALPQSFETEPLPVPGCDVCGALARARAAARAAGDMSNVSDMNVEIRRHPHGTRRRPS